MTAAEARPIALIGPMAAGKSSLGRKLASRLGRPFSDTDRLVTREHGAIPAIFAEHGEPVFRAWEAQAVAEALVPGAVVALGGGAVLDASTRTRLADATVVLVLVDDDVAERRIQNGKRPLLADGIDAWRRILDERMPTYRALADVTIDASHRPMAQLVDELEAALAERS